MRGDCQRAFAAAAAADGIHLVPQSFAWLCRRGHFALPAEALDAAVPLAEIFTALDGDPGCLETRPAIRLSGDFFHPASGTLIELDEEQHFTTVRLLALDLYPERLPLGFDFEHYRRLCKALSARADGYYRRKPAPCFGVGGRQRQRAYFDSLRDLAAPAMSYRPLVRVDAPDRDGAAAYARHRERLRALLTL